MTPREFKAELGKIAKLIGPRADIIAHISEDSGVEHVLYCAVYPRGMSGDKGNFSVWGEDFPEVLAKVHAKWAEYAAEYRQQTIAKMALAIIRITSEIGQCTDASLRATDFNADEIKRYGAEACIEANAMAGKGPFEIVSLGGANGAPDTVEQGATVN